MNLAIEDASIRHLDRLYEIEKGCFDKEAFTKRQIADLLTDYDSVSLVAKADSEIVGFIIAVIYIDRNALTGHVLTIDVSSDHRRKGIAQKLLQKMEEIFRGKDVKTCRLEAREDNVAALRLYRKLGYRKTARLEDYYKNAHGIQLKKDLT